MQWLVISDIHFSELEYSIDKLRSTMVDELRGLHPKCDFVLIAGDCLYQNDASGDTLQETANFIKDIAKACGTNSKRVFMCRGNHDVDRFDEDRNALVDEVRKKNKVTQEHYNELAGKGSVSFKQLYSLVRGSRARYKSYEVVAPKGLGARIVKLDSCLLSKDDADIGRLRTCSPRLNEIGRMIKDDDRLNIAFMHHGVGCMHPDDARQLEHWLEDNHVDVVFCGHTHQAAVDYLSDVNREIVQFTAGALTIDNYAIPSFYLCSGDASRIEVSLYTYAAKPEQWVRDDHHLRKFPVGTYGLVLERRKASKDHVGDDEIGHIDRTDAISTNGRAGDSHADGLGVGPRVPTGADSLAQNRLACAEVISELNERYFAKYGNGQIVSSKTEEREDFDAWKIVNSLASTGVPYTDALRLACATVETLTSAKYSSENVLSSTQIKSVVYNTILDSRSFLGSTSDYEIGRWASVYARHYDKETGFRLLDGTREDRLSYALLRDALLKEAVVKVTNDSLYYDKAYSSEKKAMAEHVMRFVKSLGIFAIHKEPLLELMAEYMTERPHPWFVTRDRDGIIKYHLRQADEHMRKAELGDDRALPVLQIEIAYHVCAALLARYDDYTGCTESSSVSILHHALRRIDQRDDVALPVFRYRLVQLEKDLKSCGIKMDSLRRSVDLVYERIAKQRNVTDPETIEALRFIRDTIDRLPVRHECWNAPRSGSAFEAVAELFEGAEGFKVKAPLGHFDANAFFVEPNWKITTTSNYNLGSNLLVCMLERPRSAASGGYSDSPTLPKLEAYLGMKNKRLTRELVLFKDDAHEFTTDERARIREALRRKGIRLLCVFIQERNFANVATLGWRNELLRVIRQSRFSG